ncbi:DgyrCDS4871 [Dimorphilus gyrociliatus]|uniref:DgyrCDS4871 n=1 Tax=Dimorphilus gyrociliatus TaxID=2664684 RepID=A0A7I8VJP5_9ANNE|nr:DgyrCDS4871 [Dimorphilus gyrociliatus]
MIKTVDVREGVVVKISPDQDAEDPPVGDGGRRKRSRSASPRRRRRSPTPKPTKIHIGRLTRNVNKEHVIEIFSVYGTIKSVEILGDRVHPEFSRGFAYVEYEHSDDAAKAVKYMDAGQIDGQEISVATVYPARQSLLQASGVEVLQDMDEVRQEETVHPEDLHPDVLHRGEEALDVLLLDEDRDRQGEEEVAVRVRALVLQAPEKAAVKNFSLRDTFIYCSCYLRVRII